MGVYQGIFLIVAFAATTPSYTFGFSMLGVSLYNTTQVNFVTEHYERELAHMYVGGSSLNYFGCDFVTMYSGDELKKYTQGRNWRGIFHTTFAKFALEGN
jgi:hypothetical protein